MNSAIRSPLGPRERGRKAKGKAKPQAIRQAAARRKALLTKLATATR